MLKRKRPDGDIESGVSNGNTKLTQPPSSRFCRCERDIDECTTFATVWFCLEINYMAVVYRKDRRQEIVPFDISHASVQADGPWGYTKDSNGDADGLRFTINSMDKHDAIVGNCFNQSDLTSTVYFRRRLSKLEMRLLHGCLQPSTVRRILFDSDLGDAIGHYSGVANLIWEYADPSKRRFSFMEAKNANCDTFGSFDTSLHDTAVWEDIDWSGPIRSKSKYTPIGLSSGDCVFDLTKWKKEVFD